MGRVTTIMATRNSERFIGEAIESVAKNVTPKFELLVIDANSNDNTVAVARKFPFVRVLKQRQSGLYDAWNQALAESSGDYIAFLDSDDLWNPDKMAQALDHLESHHEDAFITAHFKYFITPGYSAPKNYKSGLIGRVLPGRIPGTLVARRRAFEQVGPFDRRFAIAGDVDWFARADDAGIRGAMLPGLHLHKRIHDSNLTFDSRRNTHELLAALHSSIVRRRSEDQGARRVRR